MKSTCILLLLFFCGYVFAAGGNFGGGDGSIANPYIIEDAADLFAVNKYPSAAYILAADIDMANYNFIVAPINYLVRGHFNGNHHAIKNLRVSGDSDVGLFSILTESNVTDLGLTDANITGRNNVGILVGRVVSSNILRCYSTGTVDGTAVIPGYGNCCAGGLIGVMPAYAWGHSHIENCYSTANVTGVNEVGGLVGYCESYNDRFSSIHFNNCYSTGSVSGQDSSSIGGFCGEGHYSTFCHCYSIGSVSDNTCGGFIGTFEPHQDFPSDNNFWNTETSGADTGGSSGDFSWLVGIDNALMSQQSTYTFGSWDFINNWVMDDYYGRPLLRGLLEPQYYTVTATVGANGAVNHAGSNWCEYGSMFLLTATPDTGYVVDGWYINSTQAQNGGLTYEAGPIASDLDIEVTFKTATNMCNVTVSAGANGNVSPDGTVQIAQGEQLIIHATPEYGYEVEMWKLDGSVYQYGSNIFTLYDTQTNVNIISVDVIFESIMYSIHISSGLPVGNGDILIGDDGSTTPDGYQSVQQGDNLSITAYPASGYSVAAWYINGVPCNNGLSIYDLQNISDDMDIFVLFKNDIFTDGSGTTLDPYHVYDMTTLSAVNDDLAANYIMTEDIVFPQEASGSDKALIAYDTSHPFLGIFNGNGKKFTGFKIDSTADYLGVFGVISSANGLVGEVRGLTVEQPTVNGGSASCVAALCGYNQSGKIEKCRVTAADVTADNRVGGLCGYNTGIIKYSSAEGSVTGSYRTGLLTGNCYTGSIIDCYAIGDITVGVTGSGGGIAGDANASTISNTYSSCEVGGEASNLGGFCGWSQNSSYSGCANDSDACSAFIGGTGGGDSGAATGFNTSQMQTLNSWICMGWDFVGETTNGTNDIWRMCADGVDTPRLRWEFAPADFVCDDGVNLVDFAYLANYWGLTGCDIGTDCGRADIDGTGDVGLGDLLELTNDWLVGVN